MVDGTIICELARRSMQKYQNTVRLMRSNNQICHVPRNTAVFTAFCCSYVTYFSAEHLFWSNL